METIIGGFPQSSIYGWNSQPLLTSNQNDYVISNPNFEAFCNLSSNANGRTITGIHGGSPGRIIRLYNSGSYDIILQHQNSSSYAHNRIQMPFDLDMVLRPNDCWTLVYNPSISKWVVASGYEGYISDPSFVSIFRDDFVLGTNGNGTFGELGWSFNNNGGTPNISADETGYIGNCRISSGTTASGRGELVLNNPVNMAMPTGMILEGTIRMSAVTGLSASVAGVTAYSVIFGISNSMGATGVVGGLSQCMCFCYDRVGVNANWQCVSAGTSRTTTDSTVAVSTSYQRLKIVFNAAGTEAKYYINDVLYATHTSNFPSSGPYTAKCGIWNDATGGHTSMIMYLENFCMRIFRTTRRA